MALERDTDDAQRDVHAALVAEARDAGELFVLAEVTRGLEDAADALMHSSQQLRGHVLGHVRTDPLSRRSLSGMGAAAATGAPAPAAGSLPRELYAVYDAHRPSPGATAIGAKADGLARMARAGLRVPEAVVLTTAASRRLRDAEGASALRDLVAAAVESLEAATGLRLGGARSPLLVSIRSGAPASMPGMLETVLDVGLSDLTVRGVIAQTGNPRLAWDSYRRLVEPFAHVVHGCGLEPFEQAVRERVGAAGVPRPLELEANALEDLTREHLQRFRALAGEPFPPDPLVQLEQAVLAVLRSWDAPRAREYRRQSDVPDGLGTAVIMQRMVFGNAGGQSGAGVGFTRDPASGDKRVYLDFMLDAQGEDVVSGRLIAHGADDLRWPRCGSPSTRCARASSPPGRRERLRDVDPDALRRVHVDERASGPPLCEAIPASLGVASGPVALDARAAERLAREGSRPVLVRPDATTDDLG
ncbi:MAG: PEP/pyruvate-binding domain-containing protein, partial [Solirubrobacteraceae bacterium]